MHIKNNLKFSILLVIVFSILVTCIKLFNIQNIKQAFGDINIKNNSQSFYIEKAEFVRVVDGDTIIVNINNKNQRVRMLEINCEESVANDEKRNTLKGHLAHKFTENLLKDVKTVYLTKDKTDKDQYGRLLRLVWIDKPTDIFDEKELREKCINAIILLNGYAKVVEYDDYSYVDIFKVFEKEGINKY